MLPSRIENGRAGGPGERVHPYSRGCPVQAPWAGVLIEWPHSHCRKDPSALSVSPSKTAQDRALLNFAYRGTKSQAGHDRGIPPLTKNVKDGAPGFLGRLSGVIPWCHSEVIQSRARRRRPVNNLDQAIKQPILFGHILSPHVC